VNSYQKEQQHALNLVTGFLPGLAPDQSHYLHQKITPYLLFRETIDKFFAEHFSNICTQACYRSRRSACCSKDGIITFFADVMINVLCSTSRQIQTLAKAIESPLWRTKCIYLGENGCLWKVRPSVCAMFFCETAQQRVFSENPQAMSTWENLKDEERRFKWPDRPVLFDWLEQYVIDHGYRSPLMYLHNSPGLIRVKKRAGLS
jgi:hypothetical protein